MAMLLFSDPYMWSTARAMLPLTTVALNGLTKAWIWFVRSLKRFTLEATPISA
jgi:hypothetical protein